MARHKDDDLAAVIGEKVRKLVGDEYGAKAKLARAIDVKLATVENICKGTRCPTLIVLLRIAEHYKVSMDELVGRGNRATAAAAGARGYAAGLRLAADAMTDLAERLHDKADRTVPTR